MIFSLIAGPINTALATAPLPAVAEVKEKFPDNLPKGTKVEIKELRSAKTKHYLKDDGTFFAEISKENIFYQDSITRQWKDIDNTLVPSDKKGFDFKNKENRFEVQFPKNTGIKPIMQFTLDDAFIEFYPIGITPGTGVSQGNKISYKNAYKSTDILYTVQSDGL